MNECDKLSNVTKLYREMLVSLFAVPGGGARLSYRKY